MKSNDTYLNILISFAYAGLSKRFNDTALGYSQDERINLMIDSGAFTIYNAKTKNKKLNLDSYCNYLEEAQSNVEKYVMLDVIKNEKETKNNYQIMLDRGFNPMYVFTEYDNNWSYLKDAVKNNKHLCVAGGVSNKGKWMLKRYQEVYKNTNALIHALGFVSYPNMYKLPIHSVDSSSWIQSGQRFGSICYFDNGIKCLHYKDYLTQKKKLPYKLQLILENLQITPNEFIDLNNHKGSRGIATIINVLTYLEYQKYSKRIGLNLFLAVGTDEQLKRIVYIDEQYNLDKLRYNDYKKYSC